MDIQELKAEVREIAGHKEEYAHQLVVFAKTNPAFLADSFLQGAENGALLALGASILKGKQHPALKAFRIGSIGAAYVMSRQLRKDMRSKVEAEAIAKAEAVLSQEGGFR